MGSNWTTIDILVHELGAVRSVVNEVDAQPRLAEAPIALELRASLARAADTVHLVIGGDESMVAQARRCIGEAREVSQRAQRALETIRATHGTARDIRAESRERSEQTREHIQDLQEMRGANEARRDAKKPRAGGSRA